jgi:hypothetical protein
MGLPSHPLLEILQIFPVLIVGSHSCLSKAGVNARANLQAPILFPHPPWEQNPSPHWESLRRRRRGLRCQPLLEIWQIFPVLILGSPSSLSKAGTKAHANL